MAQNTARVRSKARPVASNVVPARTHVVKQGDSLYDIARTHGITVAALKAANQLRSNRLQIGQRLHFPERPVAAGRSSSTPVSAQPSAEVETSRLAAVESSGSRAETNLLSGTANAESLDLSAVIPAGEGADAQPTAEAQPLRIRLASTGMGFLGVRYRWNGISAIHGFDCSGLVKSLFDKFNISLPRSSREQYKVGEKVDMDNLEIGDLVFFSSRGKIPSHVGIYLGDNQFLHAARNAKRVIISSLSGSWYAKRFLGGRRLLDLWTEEPPPSETKSN